MHILFLVSYLVLWGVTLLLGLLLIGVLRQLGLVQQQLHLTGLQSSVAHSEVASSANDDMPAPQFDGPPLGAVVPNIQAKTANNFGDITPATLCNEKPVLLICMSPMCETCQHLVDPLNALVDTGAFAGPVLVLLRADEQACRAFLSVFPLHMPVICDSDRTITMGLDVQANPFGLLYDNSGVLIRKGQLLSDDDLLALLGAASPSERVQQHIFPVSNPRVSTEVGSSISAGR